jgi:predicted nucleic acid-binding protein
MAIFLDTGFYLGLVHKQDKHHDRAVEILQTIRSGSHGQIYTSNLVIAEAATIIASRTKANHLAIERARQLLSGDLRIATIIRLSEDEEGSAWDLFLKLSQTKDLIDTEGIISFIDCTSITLCQSRGIEYIATFDGHFKPWLKSP